jgi:hypothetical protein
MIVCCSLTPYNASETWWSLEFGKKVSKLKKRLVHEKPELVTKIIKELKRDLEKEER